MGPRAKYKFGDPLKKIILVDIALDNNAFTVFFTGELDNYWGEDMCVLPWFSVRAQHSINSAY